MSYLMVTTAVIILCWHLHQNCTILLNFASCNRDTLMLKYDDDHPKR